MNILQVVVVGCHAYVAIVDDHTTNSSQSRDVAGSNICSFEGISDAHQPNVSDLRMGR